MCDAGASAYTTAAPGGLADHFDQGYSAIVGLVFVRNRLHVLETFAADTPWTPYTGRVIRRNRDGSRDVIACGLNFPIGMTKKHGDLYVSTASYGQGPVEGLGQIVRIELPHNNDDDEDDDDDVGDDSHH